MSGPINNPLLCHKWALEFREDQDVPLIEHVAKAIYNTFKEINHTKDHGSVEYTWDELGGYRQTPYMQKAIRAIEAMESFNG